VQHRPLARTVGVTDQEVAALSRRTSWELGSFDDLELAVLRVTTELLDTGGVTPDLIDRIYRGCR
jgi:hypothetical protein